MPDACAKTASPKNTTKSRLKAQQKSGKIRRKRRHSKPASCGPSRAAKSGSCASGGGQRGKKPAKPIPRQPKVSAALTDAQRALIDHAAAHAIRIGKPLNRFVTINWQQAGAADPHAAHQTYLRQVRDWVGDDHACIWVKECGSVVGLHSHILLSVPPHRLKRFNRLSRGWLARAGIAKPQKGSIKSVSIGHSAAAAWSVGESFEAYQLNLSRVVAYVQKLAVPNTQGTGLVAGKRAGTSRNLGAGAIKAWGR